jgi:hypothetical protein
VDLKEGETLGLNCSLDGVLDGGEAKSAGGNDRRWGGDPEQGKSWRWEEVLTGGPVLSVTGGEREGKRAGAVRWAGRRDEPAGKRWATSRTGLKGRVRGFEGFGFIFSPKPFLLKPFQNLKHFSKFKHYKPFSKFSNHFKNFSHPS